MEKYSAAIEEFKEVIDQDNGKGYSDNLPSKGFLISHPYKNSNTKMFYELKRLESIHVIFVRYIHYDNKKELLDLLAFAVQWWKQLYPQMIIMNEKERDNAAGDYLTKLGFVKKRIPNKLKPFDCLKDGKPCKCAVYEYAAYNPVA